jgi:hypothetical protein
MGLEDTIAEAIIMALDELGGNPQHAVDAAMDCESVEQWINQETTKLALAGGAEMIIPGLHAFTIPTGISYLLHKLAYITWGIGALKGAYVIETESHSDLRNILALWANNTHFNANIIEHLAVSLEALQWTMTAEGQKAMPTLLQSETDDTTLRTYRILQELAENYVAGDERGYLVVESIAGTDTAQELLVTGKVHVKQLDDNAVILTRPLGRKISTRLAGKLASKIGARIPARFIVGFVPLAGAFVNAFLNAQTLQSMAESAEKYYDRRLREVHLVEASSK